MKRIVTRRLAGSQATVEFSKAPLCCERVDQIGFFKKNNKQLIDIPQDSSSLDSKASLDYLKFISVKEGVAILQKASIAAPSINLRRWVPRLAAKISGLFRLYRWVA